MDNEKKPDWMKHVPEEGNPRLYEPIKGVSGGEKRDNALTEDELAQMVNTAFEKKPDDKK